MITLTVTALNGTPTDGTLQVHFDELGGLIGRAETNQLVLPDPERMVSRVAAQVVYRNGAFAIVDRGSNPITLNGKPLTSGREAPLAAGDHLGICGYELKVRMGVGAGAGAAASSDPFADLLGPSSAGAPGSKAAFDPLAQRRPGPPAVAAPLAAGGIPLDWDPFAKPAAPASRPGAGAARQRDALGLDLGAAAPAELVPGLAPSSGGSSSLDQMFGLGPASGGDPLKDSMLDAPMAQPNMSGDADPLRALRSAPKASGASESDQLSDLNRPFIPPTTFKPALPSGPRARATAPGFEPAPEPAPFLIPSPSPIPSPIQSRIPSPIPSPLPAPAAPAGDPLAWDAGFDAIAPPRAPASGPPMAPAPRREAPMPRPAAATTAQDGGALLEAFRRGLNVPTLDVPALTPEMMESVGTILREAVSGTLDLMHARSTVKHEMRAEVTQISAKNNNPLKFSPNVDVALQHLLAPPARGFLAAAPAMHEAFDDLRSHQLAFVAGMQAVLENALQRFEPAALEARLGDRSLFQSLLPASRSARLWELFTEHHARIRSDAADEFHKVFGKAFLAAYEAHLDRLHDSRGGARGGPA